MGYEELHKEGFEDIRAANFSDEVRNDHKGKILEFLRFPFDFSEIESVSEFDKNKFSLRYLR